MRPLILATLFLIIAPACALPGNSLDFPQPLPVKLKAMLAAGNFGALAEATFNGKPCQALWLKNSDYLESEYHRIPKVGSVGYTMNEDGGFIYFTPHWFSTSANKIPKGQRERIRQEARSALGVE
jgi:hypothetical protein